MNRSISSIGALLCMGLGACSSAACSSNRNGTEASSHGGSTNTAGASGTSMGAGAGTSPGSGAAASGEAGASTTPPGRMASPMPLISADVPAFASSSAGNGKPPLAQDRKPDTRWAATALPAWLAYDLSTVPAAQRHQALIVWHCGSAGFINELPATGKRLPIDYTLELNQAAGGAAPPEDGWEVIATVTDNNRSTRQHLVDLAEASWVRINVSKSTDPGAVAIDLDVHDAPDGATDSWLLMGDSITFMSTSYPFSDLPELVHQRDAARFPAIIPAGIGGTNTSSALEAIDETMAGYPGRFVGLAYGTNDQLSGFNMEALVQKVIAAGKTPVVPHMPWADGATLDRGPKINQIIDDLYAKYPEILPGPDLWTLFTDRSDLIASGDVHPNAEGQALLREAWAKIMAP